MPNVAFTLQQAYGYDYQMSFRYGDDEARAPFRSEMTSPSTSKIGIHQYFCYADFSEQEIHFLCDLFFIFYAVVFLSYILYYLKSSCAVICYCHIAVSSGCIQ